MALQFHETFVTYAAETARMGSTKFIYHKLHYLPIFCTRGQSLPGSKAWQVNLPGYLPCQHRSSVHRQRR